ncbi:MAG: hypothetical protein B7Y80_12700 [Hyphomicrobium sp. 32-62-53]|nr:MAG: hypothetical protein B7Y80_12700 [Hyphomicrobium sp. 32-62-53]
MPGVVKRAFDAFRANDPIGVAEAHEIDAQFATHLDPAIATALKIETIKGPVRADCAIGILRFYAYQLSHFKVDDTEIVSATERSKGIDVVSRWSVRSLETGEIYEGFNKNRWLLDRSGRRLIAGEGYCGLLPARSPLITD